MALLNFMLTKVRKVRFSNYRNTCYINIFNKLFTNRAMNIFEGMLIGVVFSEDSQCQKKNLCQMSFILLVTANLINQLSDRQSATYNVGNVAVAIGRSAIQLNLPLLLILAQQLMGVVIPDDVRGRLECAPHHAVQNHRAASLHISVGIAD